MERYVIVGGVAAGATAAARLRRLDEHAEILLLEKGPNVSFANCGLPYYIGGIIGERGDLFVTTAEAIETRYNIDVRERNEVLSINPQTKTLKVCDLEKGEDYEITYTKLLLATGSTPFIPPIEGKNSERVFTLWTISDVDRIKAFIDQGNPKKAVIVGGGFIGLEMAENLRELGIEVDLVEMMDQVMAPLDPEMARFVEEELENKGVRLHLGRALEAISEDGRKVHLSNDLTLETDFVLLSVGVRANTQLAREAGLEVGPRGHVVVNDHMKTSDDNIYAAGDIVQTKCYVTGKDTAIPLAGPANRQGRIAADNMYLGSLASEEKAQELHVINKRPSADKRVSYKGSLGTSIAQIFDLDVANTGMNEKQLKANGMEKNKDYATTYLRPNSSVTYYPGAEPMLVKLIFRLDNGEILGAQIIGSKGVDTRIDTIATAMHFKANVHDLTHLELAYAPPYSLAKDPVNMAGYVASNILDGRSIAVNWEEALRAVEENDNNLILDTREQDEVDEFSIEGAIHVPLSRARELIDDLDKSKTYYINCAQGLRAYLLEQMMREKGFKVKNISGGINLYRVAYAKKG